MLKAILRLSMLLLIGLNACSLLGPNTPTPSGTSGVEGFVTEGPMCPGPNSINGTQCPDKPYQATISVQNTEGEQILQFETGADGYFKIPLNPGTYILHPILTGSLPIATDQTVEVNEGQYTRVSIMYDTGMR